MSKYSLEERLAIGKRIYDNEITRFEASVEYKVDPSTARDYMRLYRDTYELPVKKGGKKRRSELATNEFELTEALLKEYRTRTKKELIYDLVKAKIKAGDLKPDNK